MGLPAETGTGMRGGRGRERAGKGASIRRGLFTAFYRLLPPSAALLSLLLAAPLLLAQQPHLLIISGISGGPAYAERFRGWATPPRPPPPPRPAPPSPHHLRHPRRSRVCRAVSRLGHATDRRRRASNERARRQHRLSLRGTSQGLQRRERGAFHKGVQI